MFILPETLYTCIYLHVPTCSLALLADRAMLKGNVTLTTSLIVELVLFFFYSNRYTLLLSQSVMRYILEVTVMISVMNPNWLRAFIPSGRAFTIPS